MNNIIISTTITTTTDKLMTDELFFKVWRNLVIRNEITGLERLEIIKKKEQFKKELLEEINYYKINYNKKDVESYTKLYNRKGFTRVTVEFAFEQIKKSEIANRLYEFEDQYMKFIFNNDDYELCIGGDGSGDNDNSNYCNSDNCKYTNINSFRGNKSDIIKSYINALTPEDQLKLPTIEELIIQELNAVKEIRELYKMKCTNYKSHSNALSLFIKGESTNIQ